MRVCAITSWDCRPPPRRGVARGIAWVAVTLATPLISQAQDTQKANNTVSLLTGSSWVSNAVPTASNVLVWSSTVTGANTVALGGSGTFAGIRIANPGGAVVITNAAGNVLGLGASGIDMSAATANLTIFNTTNTAGNIDVVANQSWNIASGRTLTLFNGSNTTNTRLIGSGNIEKTGAGTVLMSVGDASPDNGTGFALDSNGNDTFTGNWTITAGKVQSQRNGTHAWGRGSITLNGGTIAQVNGNWTWSNNIIVSASSVIASDSSNGLGRSLKLVGTLTSENNSTLTFTNSTSGGTRTQNVGFILAGDSASTYGNTVISANSRVRVGGNATASVAGDGFDAGNRGSLGTGDVNLAATTAELAFTRTDTHTVANNIGGSGTLVIGGTTSALAATGTQTVIFTGSNTYSGATTIASGTLQVGSGGTAGTLGSGTVTNNATLVFNRSDALTASNVISSTGSVIKTGAGTLTLSGNSSYSGGTVISQGGIIATNANALGTSGTVTINTAATGSADTTLLLGSVTMGRAITVADLGTGSVTLGANGSVAAPEFSGAISLGKSVTLDGSTNTGRLTFTGGISGTGNVTIAGTGRVVFATTANTYSGTTVVGAGSILQLGLGASTATQFIPNSSVVNVGTGGFLKLAKGSNNETIGGLAGSGTVRGHEAVTSAASVLTIDTGANHSFGGVLEDGGASGSTLALVKSGAGTQTLTGSSSFTGGTTINAGTLVLGNATNTLADTGAVTIAGGTLDLGSNSDTIGVLSLTSGGLAGTGSLTTTSATFASADDLTVGVALGGGSLTKQGVGTLTLTAANTYTGATTISAGTLALAGSLDAASAVSVASATTLTGTGVAAGAVTLASGGILAPGVASAGTLTLGSLTFNDAASILMPVSAGGTLDSLLAVTGNVVANGSANSVTFGLGANLALLDTGTYTLMSYGGDQLTDVNAFTYSGVTGARQSLSLVNATGAIDLVVGNAFVIWSGTQGPGWNTVDNWILSSDDQPDSFIEGDVVVFNDTADTGSVDLSSNVEAATVTFNGNSLAYTLGSSNGSGFTTASLLKDGGATVTLNTANTITDGAIISGGTLVVGNAGALGSAAAQLAGGTLDVNGLTLANGIVLQGGTIAGNGGTLSGVLSGSGALQKSDAGSLILTGTNTYSGATIVGSGTLQIGAGGTTGSLGSGGVTNDATLVFNRSDSLTVANDISGNGTLTKAGAGTIILAGANAYSGATTISTGTLQVGSGGTAGTLGSGAVVNDAALVFNRSNSATFANDISGAGTLTQAGTGVVILTGANTYSGATTISSGTLQVGSGGTAGSLGSGAVTNNAALAFNRSDLVTVANAVSGSGTLTNLGSGTLTLSGGISSSGALTQAGAGTLVLTGSNTYGATTISAGTLRVGSGGAAGTLGSGAVTNNAALVFDRSDTLAVTNAISGSGMLTQVGSGTLALSSASTFSGGSLVASGAIRLGNAAALGTGTVTVASGATLDVAGFGATNAISLSGTGNGGNPALWNSSTSAAATLGGAITLAADAAVGNATTNTASLLTLSSLNLNGNKLNINQGAVSIDIRRIPSGNIDINNGGTLYSQNGGSETATTGTIAINAGGRMETRDTDNTAMTSVQGILLNGGTLSTAVITGNNGGGAGTTLRNNITVDDTNGGALIGNATAFAQNLRLTGTLSGSGPLTIGGAQGVELRGDLSGYTGTATVTEGTLTLNPSAATSFGGVIAGDRPVTKSGATMTFATAHTYTGVTTVSGGTLALSGVGDISASSSINLSASGATLDMSAANGNRTITNLAGASGSALILGSNSLTVSSTSASTFTGVISGSGSVTKNGAATFAIAGANTFSGGITLNEGILRVQNDSALGTGTLTAVSGTLGRNAGRILTNTIAISGSLSLGGSGQDSGDLVFTTGGISGTAGTILTNVSGITRLEAANTFAGLIAIQGGDVVLRHLGATNGTPDVNMTGGRLILATQFVGGTATIGNLTGSAGTINTQYGADTGIRTLQVNQTVGGTFAGNLTDGGGSRDLGFVKTGAATLTLTNAANTFTPALAINGGTLRIGEAGRLNSGAYAGNVSIVSGAALHIDTSANQTLSGTISGTGTLQKSNTGTLTLSGISSYAGAIDITGGRMILTDNNTLSGTITVGSGGTLQVGNAGTAGTIGNAARVVNDGAIEWNRSNDTNVSTLISGGGTLTKLGAGILSLNGNNTFAGTTTISSGTLRLGSGGTAGALGSGNVVNNATLAFNRSNAATVANLISGSGSVIQQGAGITTLTANNTYSGPTLVNAGTLVVNGSLVSDVVVAAGATLAGSGLYGDQISGAGLVSVGNSPGIGTAASVDPALGTDWAFEFTGFTPTWNSPTASVNDVLRLTGATPFAASLSGANEVNVLFNVGGGVQQGTYLGGFYADAADFATAIATGGFAYWVVGEYGAIENQRQFAVGSGFTNVTYSPLSAYNPNYAVSVSVVPQSVSFDGSTTVSGYSTQFVVVPEPATLVLAAAGLCGLLAAARRRRLRS